MLVIIHKSSRYRYVYGEDFYRTVGLYEMTNLLLIFGLTNSDERLCYNTIMKKNLDNRHDKKTYENKNQVAEDANDTVYGVHAVADALRENVGNKLYIQDDIRGKNVDKLKQLASEKKVGMSFVSKEKLKEMSDGGVHQGFVLKTSAYAYRELSDILEITEDLDNPLLIIIDGLTDPHNLGSILRTADATGVSGIIIPKHRSVGVTPVVVKTSTGAVNHIPITRVTNLSQTLDKLKAAGFWIFGTDMIGSPCYNCQTQGKLALIIGAEGTGITQNIKKQVDEMVTIPMKGHVQSLNAGVAAGILMYEWARNFK